MEIQIDWINAFDALPEWVKTATPLACTCAESKAVEPAIAVCEGDAKGWRLFGMCEARSATQRAA